MTIHLIGVEGAGLSGMAQIFMERRISISGSDANPGEVSRLLREKGARIYQGHDAGNLGPEVTCVVVSAAITPNNPEWQEAQRRGIPVITYSQQLGELMRQKEGVAVCGTHGKTTTTGMVAYLFHYAGLEPSFLVGGKVNQLGGNAHWSDGRHFIVEACEYHRSFHDLYPKIAVINNIDADHLDYYRDLEEITESFRTFASHVPADGLLIVGHDAYRRLGNSFACRMETFGLGNEPYWRARQLTLTSLGYRFEVLAGQTSLGYFTTIIPGQHNVSNSLAAIAAARHAGLEVEIIREALGQYQGAQRRFQILTEEPVTVVDDYAHHPAKVRAVLRAARERFGQRRLWCVFQPHQASRTRLLLQEFSLAFEDADEILVPDIYYARDSAEERSRISSADLVSAIRRQGKRARYLATFEQISRFLQTHLEIGDVLFTMGAGNITSLGHSLAQEIGQWNLVSRSVFHGV